MTSRLLLLVAVAAAVCHVTTAMLNTMVMMGGSIMRQCKNEEGSEISDEHFQRIISLDKTFLDEDVEDTKKAWNWITCGYTQAGSVDSDGNIDKDGLGMYIGAIWKDKEEKKAAKEQIYGCADISKAGQEKYHKMHMFYKCLVDKMVNKELILPAGLESMKEQAMAGKDCAGQHKVTLEDVSDLCGWKAPLNPAQAGYAACLVVATRSDGDQMCSCYIPKGIEVIKDDARRAHYEEKYKECKDSFPNYQENYDKVKEFDKFTEYVKHMYDCLVKNVDDISVDDFFQMH